MARKLHIDMVRAIKRGAKMKPILIVEDETIMRESLHDWLADKLKD